MVGFLLKRLTMIRVTVKKNNQVNLRIRWRRRRRSGMEVDRNQRVSPHLIEGYLVG